MEFRWVALIALWTLFIGPIVGAPSGPPGTADTSAKQVKPVPAHVPGRQ
jgi:hypothetical protein